MQWDEAPPGWRKPIEIPTDNLYKLEPDHPLHQIFGPIDDDNTQVVPCWQSDLSFLAAVAAMQMLKGAECQLEVIMWEQQALKVWADKEYCALNHALHGASECTIFMLNILTSTV
jgi:hypothetical protein